MRPQDLSLLANAAKEASAALGKLATQHPDVFNSLGIRQPLADELGSLASQLLDDRDKQLLATFQWAKEQGYTLVMEPHKATFSNPQPFLQWVDQDKQADQAFMDYEFGDGVMVTDTDGWSYTSPGHERTRKVYVETEREDDGPAPRWQLTFTVRFDPATGALTEAYAIDSKGQIWGALPTKSDQRATESLSAPHSAVEAQVAKTHPDFDAQDVKAVASLQGALLASHQHSTDPAPNHDAPVHQINCYVIVTGEASEDEDADVPGAYIVQLKLSRPVSEIGGVSYTFTDEDHAEMATAVLDEFHEKMGISVLDDFEISVYLHSGAVITEDFEERDTGLVLNADFCGEVSDAELPFDLPGTQPPAPGAQPGM